MDQILAICTSQPDNNWLFLDPLKNLLCMELGYEDWAELEDALHGTLEDFLALLPHVELRNNAEKDNRMEMRLRALSPDQRRPFKAILKVTVSEDLWKVFYKSPECRVEIPELEFEILPDGQNRVDTIFNHLSDAIFNLGQYVGHSVHSGTMSGGVADKISETVVALNEILDIPNPWTWIVHDPSGLSMFKPDNGVEIEYLD